VLLGIPRKTLLCPLQRTEHLICFQRVVLHSPQLTTAKYTPGSPNPWQGKLEFSADWLGKGGRAWSTENAAAPRSLGLPCDNTKTGEVLGTWSYSMPSFGNRGTTAGGKPQGGECSQQLLR